MYNTFLAWDNTTTCDLAFHKNAVYSVGIGYQFFVGAVIKKNISILISTWCHVLLSQRFNHLDQGCWRGEAAWVCQRNHWGSEKSEAGRIDKCLFKHLLTLNVLSQITGLCVNWQKLWLYPIDSEVFMFTARDHPLLWVEKFTYLRVVISQNANDYVTLDLHPVLCEV